MLDPGYYKVKKEYIDGPQFHYLHVFRKGKYLHVKNDHEDPIPMDSQDRINDLMDGLTVVKRITSTNPPTYHGIEVSVRFKDECGDEFKMAARNIHVLKSIAESFPRLLKAFGWNELFRNRK